MGTNLLDCGPRFLYESNPEAALVSPWRDAEDPAEMSGQVALIDEAGSNRSGGDFGTRRKKCPGMLHPEPDQKGVRRNTEIRGSARNQRGSRFEQSFDNFWSGIHHRVADRAGSPV